MMMNCPKCGFSQPKDRYCASCGVDMDVYQPRAQPLYQRLVRNWIFQLSMLVVALGGIAVFLQIQQQRAMRDSAALLNSASNARVVEKNVESTRDTPPANVPSQDPALAKSAAPAAAMQAGAAETGAAAHLAETGAPASPVGSPAGAASGSTSPSVVSELSLSYAEVARPVLNEFLAEARGVIAESTLSSGVISGSQRNRGHVRIVDSHPNQAVHLNQPIIVFKGVRDPNLGNLGITTQITPTATDDQGLHVLVDLQRTLHEVGSSPPSIAEQTYQQEFIIQRGSSAFIAGILPHTRPDEIDRQVYANSNLLKVLESVEFQQNLFEFVLFIDAK